jgi:HTH-type transcriptional regulator, sugar sensing transcriptional regulator
MPNLNVVMQELRDIGLTENEVSIYLALLKEGTMTPARLAQRVGMSRPYVYDAIERLIEKGVLGSVLQDQKRCYLAVPPQRLAEMAADRAQRMQNVVAHLAALQEDAHGELSVEVHKGRFVYRTLLLDILSTLKKGDEVLIYGIDDNLLYGEEMGKKRLDLYFAKCQRLGIKERAIVKEDNRAPKSAKDTLYRTLPAKTIGATAFEVYGDRLAILLLGNPNHLILVKNKRIAESYKSQFEILWKNAKSSKVRTVK